jgi:D-threo-aldose 1-dehydrogenase
MDPLARRRLGLTAVEVTQLGFGGAGLGDLFEVIPEAQAAATLEAVWDAGIRYYDTAPWYGLTQSEHRWRRPAPARKSSPLARWYGAGDEEMASSSLYLTD